MGKRTVNAEWNSYGRLGDGLAVPSPVTITVTGEPFDLVLAVELQGGRFVCRDLRVTQVDGGPPVTGEALRRIPVSEVIRTALEDTIVRGEQIGPELWEAAPMGAPRRDIARHGPTDEALKHVAAIYRFTHALGESPTKGVQERLGLPRSTAARWVALARERGYLGAASVGKAGEVTTQPLNGGPAPFTGDYAAGSASAQIWEMARTMGAIRPGPVNEKDGDNDGKR